MSGKLEQKKNAVLCECDVKLRVVETEARTRISKKLQLLPSTHVWIDVSVARGLHHLGQGSQIWRVCVEPVQIFLAAAFESMARLVPMWASRVGGRRVLRGCERPKSVLEDGADEFHSLLAMSCQGGELGVIILDSQPHSPMRQAKRNCLHGPLQ